VHIVKPRLSPTRPSPAQNHLLAAFPPEVYERLLPHLELVPLSLGSAIHEPRDAQAYAHFPIDGVVSLIYLMEDGSAAEFAIVGHEGVVGTSLFMGGGSTPSRAIVTSAGNAYRLRASVLNAEFERGGEIQHLMLRFTQARITQTAQTVLCTRYHEVKQQLCRWLLMTLDRVHSNEIAMTQELIASMLGVRREGVTEAAGKLQAAGLIHYRRGHISVLDRRKLEENVCECYAVVKKEYDRLLPEVLGHSAGRRSAGSSAAY
jgi:CRP-like cAMP-binding protein